MGVKNQRGRIIKTKIKRQIANAEKFFDFVLFRRNSYTGKKMVARIIPVIIESKIGFMRKKDKTIKARRIRAVVTLLR